MQHRAVAKIDLHPDRFFPADRYAREIARTLYGHVRHLPIVSPHGHTDPRWFASDTPFSDATSVFLWPDHYVLRMLYSQGIGLDALGLASAGGAAPPTETDRQPIWRLFRAH